MKRSRIFLGITTALLAIAGVAAAKHFGPSVKRYYCSLGNKCISFSCVCTNSGVTQCTMNFTTTTNGEQTIHVQNVYSSGTNGASCSVSMCSGLVRYATEHW